MEKTETVTGPEKLKCKFCNVKVRRWRKIGKQTIDGWDTLKEHILLYHPQEAEKMGMSWYSRGQ